MSVVALTAIERYTAMAAAADARDVATVLLAPKGLLLASSANTRNAMTLLHMAVDRHNMYIVYTCANTEAIGRSAMHATSCSTLPSTITAVSDTHAVRAADVEVELSPGIPATTPATTFPNMSKRIGHMMRRSEAMGTIASDADDVVLPLFVATQR